MSSKIEFLYLSEEDTIKAGVKDMHRCVEVMEEVFNLVGQGDYLMGGPTENSHGMKIFFPKEKRFPNMPVAGPDRRFMAMVAYLGGRFNVCGEKWYGSNIKNPSKRGWPRSILMTIINDPESAAPLAIMSANLISATRTGALPGLGAKYLAKNDSRTIGIVGAGVIGVTSLMALVDVLKNVTDVKVFDISKEKAIQVSKQMSELLRVNIYPVDTMEEAVIDSDVVNFATAGAKLPFIKWDLLKDGCLLTLPAGVDLDEQIVANARFVFDEWKMNMTYREELRVLPGGFKNYGLAAKYVLQLIEDGKMKDEDVISLGQLVTGQKQGRLNDKEIIVFSPGGMPVEDVAWTFTLYENAKKMGVGQTLTLWDEPYLF